MKERIIRAAAFGFVFTLVLATLAAATMTYIDWKENPSGTFHDATGTQWALVRSAFSSWFWPIVMPFFTITTVIRFSFSNPKSRS